jgi:hypothetical protein
VVTGNKRVFYACLALARCGESPLTGVRSASLSLSRPISNVFKPRSKDPIATYANLSDLELSYDQWLSNYSTGIIALKDEPGLAEPIGFDYMIGSDTLGVLTTPLNSIRTTNLLLSNVTYNFSTSEPFSVQRSFKGWNKTSGCIGQTVGFAPNSSPDPKAVTIYTRQAFLVDASLPAVAQNNPLQSVEVQINIQRNFINEFGTRRPYASVVTFPIETTCTFTVIVQNLDPYELNALQTACENGPSYKQDIKIKLCSAAIGDTLTIKDAYLTNFSYSGGEASSGGSNLELTVTYIGYRSPDDINPVIKLEDYISDDPCEC